MLRFERILCPVDFSDYSTRACDYAYSLAMHYGSKLFFEHVVQPLTAAYPYYAFPDTVDQIYWNLGAAAEERLHEITKGYSWNGAQPQFVVERGLVPESILNFSVRENVDLIVMGTHGRQGLDRLTMGSVTEKVLRKSRCPVLAVRKPGHDFVAPTDKVEPVHLKKIIYATDFSDTALRALDYALSLAMEYNSELTLLHVLEEVPGTGDLQSATARALHQLENPIPQDATNWCTVKPVVRLGKPYEEIIQLALESQADLIVMGVRGRNALDLGLFGSTTHRVLQLGSSPVLAVRV